MIGIEICTKSPSKAHPINPTFHPTILFTQPINQNLLQQFYNSIPSSHPTLFPINSQPISVLSILITANGETSYLGSIGKIIYNDVSENIPDKSCLPVPNKTVHELTPYKCLEILFSVMYLLFMLKDNILCNNICYIRETKWIQSNLPNQDNIC